MNRTEYRLTKVEVLSKTNDEYARNVFSGFRVFLFNGLPAFSSRDTTLEHDMHRYDEVT